MGEWDEKKDKENQRKHGGSFAWAQHAFGDPDRVIAEDIGHGQVERRCYCMDKIGEGIMTVRFTYRKRKIRIISAGYWRKGKDIYCHDIIKGQFTLFVTNEAFIGEVVWTGWCYAVSILRPITYRSSRPNNLDVTSRWEVIGNRFGTPELLTDEEKQKDLWKKWREQVLKEMEEERCG